jgi:hypothetical protein
VYNLQPLESIEISTSVSTYESDNFNDELLAAIGSLTAVEDFVEIGAVSLRLGKSGGGNVRTSIELRLWYNSFCNFTLASLSKVTMFASNNARTGR